MANKDEFSEEVYSKSKIYRKTFKSKNKFIDNNQAEVEILFENEGLEYLQVKHVFFIKKINLEIKLLGGGWIRKYNYLTLSTIN